MLIPTVALGLVISPGVAIGLAGSSATASTTPLPAPWSGEIAAAVASGCLNDNGGTLSVASCDGKFGEQLWTIEADQTIRW